MSPPSFFLNTRIVYIILVNLIDVFLFILVSELAVTFVDFVVWLNFDYMKLVSVS